MSESEEIIKKSKEAEASGDVKSAANIVADAIMNGNSDKLLYSRLAKLNEASDEISEICTSLLKKLIESGKKEQTEKLLFSLKNRVKNPEYLYMAGEFFLNTDNFDAAVEYYLAAAKNNPENAVYYFKAGLAYSLKGFINEAENCFSKASIYDDNNPDYRYALAYLYYTVKKYTQPEKITDYILSKHPEYEKAVALKILLCTQSGDLYTAGTTVKSVNVTTEDFTDYAFAMYYKKMNMYDKAEKYLKNAVKKNSGSLDYKYELGLICFDKKDYENCKKICADILKINDKYIQACTLSAKVAFETGDMQTAIDYTEKALKLDINNDEAYYIKGLIKQSHCDYKSACECYKTAISISPVNAIYYAKAAECLFELNDFEAARLYYKEAAATDITNADYHYRAAKCAEITGDNTDALCEYSLMHRLAPSNTEYNICYAEFSAKTGNKSKALSILKETLSLNSDEINIEKLKKIIKKIKKEY